MGNCCFGFDAIDGHFFIGWGIFGTFSIASEISGLKIYNNKISASDPHAYFYNLYNWINIGAIYYEIPSRF